MENEWEDIRAGSNGDQLGSHDSDTGEGWRYCGEEVVIKIVSNEWVFNEDMMVAVCAYMGKGIIRDWQCPDLRLEYMERQ